jgi:hypothetical protein
MTNERFNELLNGPLHHPLVPFVITRLSMALRAVVEATGKAGDDALEQFCRQRDERDRFNGDEDDDD